MTTTDGPAANVPPGWYPYQRETEPRWWDGTRWFEPSEHNQSSSAERGAIWMQIQLRPSFPELRIYENEAWKIMPAGVAGTTGGSIAGATAEVVVQSQLQLRANIAGGSRTLGATLLRVRAPSFDLTFSLDQKRDQSPINLARLNQIAEFINTRSLQLAPKGNDTPSAVGTVSVADELAKFAALRDQGVITDEEFTAKKAQLLS
jgi:Short C-terminal domain